MKLLVLFVILSLIQPFSLQAQSKQKAQKEFLKDLNKASIENPLVQECDATAATTVLQKPATKFSSQSK
jgi:hypothetical protein